ncbi:hypothetical protein [Falsiroseomonas sp.]|uniref:hypothetical protein n=1 Tax=Falsiroseomonas sp. TaxID=2870721 RepID=UPI003F6ED13B
MRGAPAALRDALQPGEEIRWHGRPHPTKGLGWAVFISLLGFFLLMLIARPNPNALMTINDVPVHDPATRRAIRLLFMAVTTATSLFFPYQLLRRLRTIYAVTDRRVLVLAGLGLPGAVHSFPPWSIWGTERPDKPSADAVGRLLILRAKPREKPDRADEWLVQFSAIRDDIGAQAAINRLVAAPKPLIGREHALVPPPERLGAAFASRLRPDEVLLWAAQPEPVRYARTVLFGSVFILLLLFPFFLLMRATGVFDVVTTGFGVCLLLAPVLAWFRASWTGFGITTQRVIVLDHTPLLGRETSWPLDAIESVLRPWSPKRAGSLTLCGGRRLDTEDNPARLVLRALPDIAAAEAALFVALEGRRRRHLPWRTP